MCAELAAGELKSLFLKIHYFGRKLAWARRRRARAAAAAEEREVEELLKIIRQIRARYPHKQIITSVDVLEVLF